MPVVPNPHVYPPDGYYFVDSDGVKHTGKNWSDLVQQVRDYRVRNGKPVGSPIQEINAFTCARYPAGCVEVTKCDLKTASSKGGVSKGAALAAAVNRWLQLVARALGENPTPLVSKEEAQKRAAICTKCPRQAAWASSCAQCAGAAFRIGVAIRKNQDVARGDSLMGCSVLGEDTRTSVWLPRLKPAEQPELPENCWRKAP